MSVSSSLQCWAMNVLFLLRKRLSDVLLFLLFIPKFPFPLGNVERENKLWLDKKRLDSIYAFNVGTSA